LTTTKNINHHCSRSQTSSQNARHINPTLAEPVFLGNMERFVLSGGVWENCGVRLVWVNFIELILN